MPAAFAFHSSFWIALAMPVIACAHVGVSGQDYSGFERNDGGGSCCNWHDCRPALEPFMEHDGEKIMDRARNKFAFDPGKVVKRPSDDGNWHVCGNGRTLTCIIAPPQVEREPAPFDRLFGWLAQPSTGQTAVPDEAGIERELAAAPICRATVP